MALYPCKVINALRARRLLCNHTRVTADTAHGRGSSVYCGFDPTAPDLHIGNLLAILGLAHFQLEGYQPVAVVGGATALVGDPSGHSNDRESISRDSIISNIDGITATLNNIFHNITSALKSKVNRELLELKTFNNANWYDGVSVVDFMSKIGRHFRMAPMMNKDSVQTRLNSPEGLSYTEFSYQVFQAYDFLYLHENHKCLLQLGGSDQWGNITAGCSLIHKHTQACVHGVTIPLVTTAAGDKLSKSAGNAIMLSSSPYHLYQYFYKTSDNDVERFLNYFTFATTEEVSDVMGRHKVNPDANLAQKYLAKSVTQLVHGDEGCQQALSATNALFGGQPLYSLTHDTLCQLFSDAPHHTLSLDCYNNSPITDIFTDIGAIRRGETTNLLKQGALYVNNDKIDAEDSLNVEKHILNGNISIIRRGKSKYYLIKWT